MKKKQLLLVHIMLGVVLYELVENFKTSIKYIKYEFGRYVLGILIYDNAKYDSSTTLRWVTI